MDVYLPIVTLVFGATLAWLAEERRDARAFVRDKAVRQEIAEEERTERLRGFQAETLIALQDALLKLVDAAFDVQADDREHERLTDAWRPKNWPSEKAPDIVLKFFETTRRVSYVRVRVENDDLRTHVEKVQYAATRVVWADSLDASTAASSETESTSNEANSFIGSLLRATY